MKISKTNIARQLRQEQTEAEKLLWDFLRNRKVENLKFRRQHPLKDYIVDFYCHELMLVIELDGGYHNKTEQKFKDEQRDFHLEFLGYIVLRYKNEIVTVNPKKIFEDITKVKQHRAKNPIKKYDNQSPLSGGRGAGGEEIKESKNSNHKIPSSSIKRADGADVTSRTILSTKTLSLAQKNLILNAGVGFVEYDAIKIVFGQFEMPRSITNAIFTSQNAVRVINFGESQIKNCFCVGDKTAELLKQKGQNVIKIAQNASDLGEFIAEYHKNERFYFFSGNKRRDELPEILKENTIDLTEISVYETKLNYKKFEQDFDAILFFSPSGVEAFTHHNPIEDKLAVCIGETTAAQAKKHALNIAVANSTSIESVIAKAVKKLAK